jgi:hypothetical protein
MFSEGDREVAKQRNKPTKKIMKIQTKLMGLAVAGAVVLASVAPANAVPTIRYSVNGGAAITITDELAGDADAGNPGGIAVVGGTGGQLSFHITSASTKPVSGSAALPVMSLNINATAAANSPATKTLEVWFTETDFGPTSALLLTDLSSTGLAGWMASSYVDDSNVSFGTATLLTMLTTSNTGAAGPVASALPTDPFTSYSLTTYLKLTISAGASANGTLTVRSAIPDGGSTVAFLGMALVAVEGVRRKFAKA